jgi:hypothetical protein
MSDAASGLLPPHGSVRRRGEVSAPLPCRQACSTLGSRPLRAWTFHKQDPLNDACWVSGNAGVDELRGDVGTM